MPRLKRVDCTSPGLTRRRQGRGFRFEDAAGTPVSEPETLARINALGIPPAWRDVWICADANGHLQATGIDAAGRKQYRYHDRWRERRDRQKFEDMLNFAATLPRLRRCVRRDLRGEDPDRARVLAGAIRLLDLGFFRVGSDHTAPAEDRDTFGLTTMLKSHASVDAGRIVFDYVGKSHQHRVQAIADAELLALITQLKRRRGGPPELLAYREGRRWHGVSAEAVNAHLKALIGEDFSTKDFRTWNATVLAAIALASENPPPSTPPARKRAISRAVKTVSEYLGNTPTVARNSYIDPQIFDRFHSGWTIAPLIEWVGGEPELADGRVRTRIEAGVLDLLTEAGDSEVAQAA